MSQRMIFTLGVLVGGILGGVGTCAQVADCGEPCEIVISPEMCIPHCPEAEVDCQLCAEECKPDCPNPRPVVDCDHDPPSCPPCPEPCCPEPRVRVGYVQVPAPRYDAGLGLGARDTTNGSIAYAVAEFSWRPARGLWGVRIGLTGDLERTDIAKPHPEWGYRKVKHVKDRAYGVHALVTRSW